MPIVRKNVPTAVAIDGCCKSDGRPSSGVLCADEPCCATSTAPSIGPLEPPKTGKTPTGKSSAESGVPLVPNPYSPTSISNWVASQEQQDYYPLGTLNIGAFRPENYPAHNLFEGVVNPGSTKIQSLVHEAEELVATRIRERVVQHIAESMYVDLCGPKHQEQSTDSSVLQGLLRKTESELKEAAETLYSAAKFLKEKGFSVVASNVFVAARRAEEAVGE